MLRTIGMTRRQARRMTRHESSITALIAATLGLFLGWVITQAVPDSAAMTIPWPSLGGVTLAALVPGIGAAIVPRAVLLHVSQARSRVQSSPCQSS